MTEIIHNANEKRPWNSRGDGQYGKHYIGYIPNGDLCIPAMIGHTRNYVNYKDRNNRLFFVFESITKAKRRLNEGRGMLSLTLLGYVNRIRGSCNYRNVMQTTQKGNCFALPIKRYVNRTGKVALTLHCCKCYVNRKGRDGSASYNCCEVANCAGGVGF